MLIVKRSLILAVIQNALNLIALRQGVSGMPALTVCIVIKQRTRVSASRLTSVGTALNAHSLRARVR